MKKCSKCSICVQESYRSENKAQVWKTEKQFCDCYHEKINLESRKYNDSKRKECEIIKFEARVVIYQRKANKCYKCRETGHIVTQCKRLAVTKRACYGCRLSEHLAKNCSEWKQAVTAEAGGKSAQTTSTNMIQPAALPKPYMVSLKINAVGKCGNINTYVIDAIINWDRQLALFMIVLFVIVLLKMNLVR